jgi:serine/threonine protein kinase
MTPPPLPNDPPTPGKPLLQGMNLGGLFSLGMTDDFEAQANAAQAWKAPAAEDIAYLFPGYEVRSLIGRGGMGAVYEARQLDLDRKVAIKLLPMETSLDEGFVQRFQREARAMARLQHPGIVAVYQFGTARDGRLYFVMEFVDGMTLFDLIHSGHLTVAQALEIVKQVSEALAYAHEESVVHRDIKPSNILVDKKGRVKVADFGLAKMARTAKSEAASLMHTQTGHIMGTPDYAAPEQMRGGTEVDHRADIYSLGVMFYEMLTGEVPRGLFVPPSEKTGTDTRLDKVVLRALHENPAKRYQQATQLRDEVTKTQASGVRGADAVPRPAKPVPPPQNSVMRTLYTVWRMAKDGSGWKAVFGAFVLMALTAIIGVSVALWGPHQWFTKPKPTPEAVVAVKSSVSQATTVPKAARSSSFSSPEPKPVAPALDKGKPPTPEPQPVAKNEPAASPSVPQPKPEPTPTPPPVAPRAMVVEEAPPEPKPSTPKTEASFNGKRFVLNAQPMTWTQAHEHAKAQGGRLATVMNAEHNRWLAQTFAPGADGLFLGGQCWMPGGLWEWDSGSKWTFSAWSGEVPIYGVLILQADGAWKPGSFEDKRPFVMELP